MNSSQMKIQARRAYEWGRLVRASKLLYVVSPLVAISLFTCGSISTVLVLGAALGALVVLLKWRGEEYGKSVGPGLIAGSAAFIVPLVLDFFDICCEGPLQLALCLASGVLGGVLLGRILARHQRLSSKTVAFAIAVSGLTVVLGCASLGIGAIAGLVIALTVAALSSVSLVRANK